MTMSVEDTSVDVSSEDSFDEVASKSNGPIEYTFGCRHPDSLEGDWDRAFVFGKCKGDNIITLAVFNDGKDFVGHVSSYAEAFNQYQGFIKDGWVPMNAIDIKRTSGIDVDAESVTVPWTPKDTWWTWLQTLLFSQQA